MNIITLTLNPAIDVHCYTEHFQPYRENLATVTSRDIGGKGINISRALTANKIENTALIVLGQEDKASFCRAMDAEGLTYREIVLPGKVRENITLHTSGSPETRISFSGFSADDTLIDRVESDLLRLLDRGDILTLTGRNPEGIGMSRMKTMLANLKSMGIRIVLDSRSFSLSDLLEIRPWLIKPNEEEIASYASIDVHDFPTAKSAAEHLHERGIENVMISLGARGALLCCPQGCFAAQAPSIETISTIGAGDSSIAGFCAATELGLDAPDRLRYAVSYGSAACMVMGTQAPREHDVQELLGQIEISTL